MYKFGVKTVRRSDGSYRYFIVYEKRFLFWTYWAEFPCPRRGRVVEHPVKSVAFNYAKQYDAEYNPHVTVSIEEVKHDPEA